MKRSIRELLGTENAIERFLETQDKENPVILFGTGVSLREILQLVLDCNFNVACLCDNNRNQQSTVISGYDVLSLGDSIEKFPDAKYIISATYYFDEIRKQLLETIGEERIVPFNLEFYHFFRRFEFRAFFEAHIGEYEDLYNSLADEDSRNALYYVTKGHLSGSGGDFESAYGGDWHMFNDLLRARPDDTYIDCGAYDGDTVLQYCEASKMTGYKRIIALEPDHDNHAKLVEAVRSHSLRNVDIIKKGTWKESGELEFTGGGYSASISNINRSDLAKSSNYRIPVISIDDLLEGERADIIKMDVEGAEYESLLGAERTIKSFRPKLAICVYHRVEDLIRISRLLRQFVPEYRLYLRHHTKWIGETILYAV